MQFCLIQKKRCGTRRSPLKLNPGVRTHIPLPNLLCTHVTRHSINLHLNLNSFALFGANDEDLQNCANVRLDQSSSAGISVPQGTFLAGLRMFGNFHTGSLYTVRAWLSERALHH